MALKYALDTLDGVPELHRSFYTEKGGKFTLDVDGVVPKERMDAFRETNVALDQQLRDLTAKFKDIDPEVARTLIERAAKERDKRLIDSGKVEELLNERTAAMKADHDKVLKAITDERDRATTQLGAQLIDGAIRDAAAKARVRPTAIDDVLLRGRAVFHLKDGKAVPMDGDKMIFGKSGEPMDVPEFVAGLTERAPHLFEPSTGAGAKSALGGGAGGRKTITRTQFDALDPAAKSAAIKEMTVVD